MKRQDSFHRTGLSRRQFIASTAALGLFTATAPVLTAPAFAQSTPKRGGTLAIGIEGASTGDTLDPRNFNSPYWAVAAGTIFNTLVEVQGSANELKPGLAKSWEGSNGGKTWVFDLVDNATFHNGKPVTAADVIYSLQIHNAEDSRSNSRAIAAGIASMSAEGFKLTVELTEGNYFFPAMLSNYPLCIIPEGTTAFDGIGSGGNPPRK